jgi:hypothetical protein
MCLVFCSSEFPVEKTVLPDEILEVVCRGLAVTSHTMGKKVSTDLLMVGAMLPQIHVTLLKVLDSLIIWSVLAQNVNSDWMSKICMIFGW